MSSSRFNTQNSPMVSNAPSASIEHHSTPSEAESSRGYLGDGRDTFINASNNITAQATTAMDLVMRPMVPSSSHDLSRQPSASHGPEVLSSVAIAAGLVSSADYVNQGDSVTGPRAFATNQPITAAEILDNWVNATGISPEERADRKTVKGRILAANPTHGLHVNGDLNLSFCRNLTQLPEGLRVGGTSTWRAALASPNCLRDSGWRGNSSCPAAVPSPNCPRDSGWGETSTWRAALASPNCPRDSGWGGASPWGAVVPSPNYPRDSVWGGTSTCTAALASDNCPRDLGWGGTSTCPSALASRAYLPTS